MVDVKIYDKSYSLQEREQIINRLNPGDNFQGVCIQTCNRLELYSGDGEVHVADIEHLFRVVSGLESGLVGDMSIQGQVKQAYSSAIKSAKLGVTLNKLFQTALFVGKRVRTETGISVGAMSHSQAAVELLYNVYNTSPDAHITILGVHNINENIVRYLGRRGANTIFVGNRTFEKARDMADRFGCGVFPFSELNQKLKETDVLITATSAPHTVIHKANFPTDRKMLIIDIAVPRDVEPEIGDLPLVELINLDEVESLVNQNVDKRKGEIVKAEEIVKEEVENFLSMLKRRQSYVACARG